MLVVLCAPLSQLLTYQQALLSLKSGFKFRGRRMRSVEEVESGEGVFSSPAGVGFWTAPPQEIFVKLTLYSLVLQHFMRIMTV